MQQPLLSSKMHSLMNLCCCRSCPGHAPKSEPLEHIQTQVRYAACFAGEGWVSGYAGVPSNCAGISLRACTRCTNSADMAGCLQCVNKPAFKLGMLQGAQSVTLSKADGCGSCYNSSRPDECVACLEQDTPCGQCALEQPDSSYEMDVSACVACTQRHGERYQSSCTLCSFLGKNQLQMQQCMACIAAIKPVACDKTDYPSSCWNPALDSFACAGCASRAKSFGRCLFCMRSIPYSGNCHNSR
jgi:hypothetical protein